MNQTSNVIPFSDALRRADPAADKPGAEPVDKLEVAPGEWEAELPDSDVADAEAQGVTVSAAVDPPDPEYPMSLAETMKAKDAARRPVIPPWLANGAERRAAARWMTRHYAAVVSFHATRLPLYAARLALNAPRGLWRTLSAWSRWVGDAEGRPLRAAAARSEDAAEYLRLSRQRDDRVRVRWVTTTLAGTVLLVGVLLLAFTATWALTVIGALVAGMLGWAGIPADRPLIEGAQVTFRARKLTSDVVSRAFVTAGLTRPDQGITFPRPIARDGAGWRVTVDLPYGKTFTNAMKAHESLASGLDVAATQVFLDKDATSSRRVALWVADQDPLAVPVGVTPLLGVERVDFWRPFPWGRDERGNEVMVTMLWLSLLIGAVPRQGKTFSARVIALAASLDPFVRIIVFDGKASPDWRGFAKVAHRVGFGIVPKNGLDPVAHLIAALQELKSDVEDRYHRLSELPLTVCPEGKLTPALSRDKRYSMPLTLVVIDEVQEYLQHPTHGAVILDLLVYLARVAPAVGVSVMTSTQKPDDKACPSVLRDQHQARFSLKVGSWQVSDVVLGAGSYSEGLDASRLLRSHKGVGLLKGMNDEAGIVRTYLADGRHAEAILTRAHALRQVEGTLTGDAVGELADDSSPTSLLDDIAAVLSRAEERVWSETVVDRLAEHKPDTYGPWAELEGEAKSKQLAAALKPFGIGTEQIGRRIDRRAVTRRGIVRDHIIAAITERDTVRRGD